VGDLVRASDVEDLAWRCIGHLERLLPSAAISFDLVAPDGNEGETVAAIGVSDYFLTRYEQVGRQQDPVLQRAISTRATSDNAAIPQREEWCSLPIYRDVFRLHKLTNVLYAPVVVDGQVIATVDVGRDDRAGRFTVAEVALVRSLAAGAGATLAFVSERERLGRERRHLRAALDSCEDAVVVTDAVGGSRYLNAAARALLSQLGEDPPSLDDLLRRSGDDVGPLLAETHVELQYGESATLRCRSAPLKEEPDVVVSVMQLGQAAPLAKVVEASLTRRERDVARLAIQGLHDWEIGEDLNLSPHTVKHHLKAIYRKLGISSRVGLVRAAAARTPAPGNPNGGGPKSARMGVFPSGPRA
jgi:DNA-binding CsgD family transcriptional regulator/GAF domain-containing protein